jgi:hypothetical protein
VEGERRFEDLRRRIAGCVGVLELAAYGLEGDLLLVCKGVEERLSGFKGRDVGGFGIGDRDCGEDISISNRGVSCEALAGEDGGSGVAEALFNEAFSRTV